MARRAGRHGSLEGWRRRGAAYTLPAGPQWRHATTDEDKTMPTAPLDLLTALHKALRCALFDLLAQVGRIDVSDRAQLQQTTRRLQRLLAMLNEAPGTFAGLLVRWQRGPAARREAAARVLYQELADWTVGMLQRLAREQARHQARPCASPEAQAAQRQRQLASLDEAELREALYWFGRALTPQELAAVLADLRAAAVGARFGIALDALAASLDGAGWDPLARAMGIPQVTLPCARPREPLPLAA
jgi:hypothetical protein